MKTVRVVIEGKVQGVWFRAWTVQEAERHGLRGWVRNRRDGSVEALFAGPPDAVDAVIDACHRGPLRAKVSAVRAEPADGEQVPEGFEQAPTA